MSDFAAARKQLQRRDLLRALVAASLPQRAAAQPRAGRGEMRILLAGDRSRHEGLLRALRDRWPQVTETTGGSAGQLPPPLAYLTVGPQALQAALGSTPDAPLVSVLVSRQAFEQILDKVPPRGATAIHAEPAAEHQMRVIAAVLRRRATVGALVSGQSRYIEPLLRKAAADANLQLLVESHDAAIGLSRNLLRLTSADALLIFPDSSVYTQESLRELLESTYRRRQPVFGFSEALVKAGTLASAFSSADDLAAHVAETLAAIADGRLPLPQHPRYWRVAINDNVARSLDIVVDESARSLGDRP